MSKYGAIIFSKQNEETDPFINDEEMNQNDDSSEHIDYEPGLFQQMVAECVGTCILTQIGCAGLCVSTYLGVYDGLWQTAVIWLLAAAIAISCTSSISGGHLNPAVSVSNTIYTTLSKIINFLFHLIVLYVIHINNESWHLD